MLSYNKTKSKYTGLQGGCVLTSMTGSQRHPLVVDAAKLHHVRVLDRLRFRFGYDLLEPLLNLHRMLLALAGFGNGGGQSHGSSGRCQQEEVSQNLRESAILPSGKIENGTQLGR